MKVIFLTLLFLFQSSFASGLSGSYSLEKSEITYHMSYLLKDIKGKSHQSKGMSKCDKKECQFLIAAPIKSFQSKDSKRDLNMLSYTKASEFPFVQVKFNIPLNSVGDIKVNLSVEIANKKFLYKDIHFSITQTSKGFISKGEIPFKLSNHHIERPNLMMVSVKDLVPIEVETEWYKKQ